MCCSVNVFTKYIEFNTLIACEENGLYLCQLPTDKTKAPRLACLRLA